MASIYRKSEIPADLLCYFERAEIGLESTPDEFVQKMVDVGRAVHRVLRDDGTFWLNIGDSYSGNSSSGGIGKQDSNLRIVGVQTKPGKPKDLCMMPWRVAMALQADGWWIRSVIVWAKKSPMPESCTDRPTSSWEPIFLLAKSSTYFYDAEAVKEAGTGGNSFSGQSTDIPDRADNGRKDETVCHTRNQRNVWHLGPEPYKEAHFATFPTEIPRRAIKAGTSEKGCCPACGAPWTRVVERSSMGKAHSDTKFGKEHSGGPMSHSRQAYRAAGMEGPPSPRTVGWEPGCACDAGEPVPCLVLDPFLGSGTTVAVARELGRHGVGCELNPEYAKLAAQRIGKAERPETYRDDTKETDAPLFMENQ